MYILILQNKTKQKERLDVYTPLLIVKSLGSVTRESVSMIRFSTNSSKFYVQRVNFIFQKYCIPIPILLSSA